MQKVNEDVRRAARTAGVPLWRIAEALQVSEPTLTRWMRTTLPDDKRDRIMKAIPALEREAGHAG